MNHVEDLVSEEDRHNRTTREIQQCVIKNDVLYAHGTRTSTSYKLETAVLRAVVSSSVVWW